MEEGYSSKAARAFNIVMFLFTGVFVLLFSYLTGKSDDQVIRNTIVSLLISAVVIFMLQDDTKRGEKSFSFDNYYNRHRFFVAYMVMVVMSCILSLMPAMLWPYLSIFVILAYLSNYEIGLIAGTGFAAISVMLLPNASYSDLLMHVLAGAVAIALFRDPDREKGIALPMFISLMMQAVLFSAFGILFYESRLSAQLLIMPISNLMVNMVVLFVFMNFVSVYIIGNNDEEDSDANTAESDRDASDPYMGRDNTEDWTSMEDGDSADSADGEDSEVAPLSHEETVEMIRNLLDKYDYVPLEEREKYISASVDDSETEAGTLEDKDAERKVSERDTATDEVKQDDALENHTHCGAADEDKVSEAAEELKVSEAVAEDTDSEAASEAKERESAGEAKESEASEVQQENRPAARRKRGRKPKKAEPSNAQNIADEESGQEKPAAAKDQEPERPADYEGSEPVTEAAPKKKRGRRPKRVEPENDAIS